MSDVPTVALLGDNRGHRSHTELDHLVPRLADELGVSATWVPTDSIFDVLDYAGIWLVPGSPYANDGAVLDALTVARESRTPFLGTCGGMQYAVLEFTRRVLGISATHEESDGRDQNNAVSALACSLYGEQRTVRPLPRTRFASWVAEPFEGMHFCNYAPTSNAVARLEEYGVVVGATADDAGAEVLEFPDHPFYITSMFQPHIGASDGAPIHPLLREFAKAVVLHARG